MRGARVIALALTALLGACGSTEDDHEDPGAGTPTCGVDPSCPSDDETLASAILSAGANLNECDTVEDCVPVRYRACSSTYVNRDRAHELDSLEADLDLCIDSCEGCVNICARGILSCTEGHCLAEALLTSDPLTAPEGSKDICL